jgi:hypothetical protein
LGVPFGIWSAVSGFTDARCVFKLTDVVDVACSLTEDL